ncbi:hypothetical protein [Glycomyces artemisiae]|uniref:Uncharacterized protein n=1 Tax=Glycomyces artemisiae TaxID=1076443 RepID=A0A2T0UWR0_9ACTN|nr:hypothetical protein [Glycomyces artemisiae]PRY62359.1 hypothetical protein B0I28_101687 [Glycomyces artemisiae]
MSSGNARTDATESPDEEPNGDRLTEEVLRSGRNARTDKTANPSKPDPLENLFPYFAEEPDMNYYGRGD